MGVKALDFAEEFNALGISVQLKQLHQGSFVLANKEGRVSRICKMLDLVEQQGTISKSRAAEIQGHLNFAGGFLYFQGIAFSGVVIWAVSRLTEINQQAGSPTSMPIGKVNVAINACAQV